MKNYINLLPMLLLLLASCSAEPIGLDYPSGRVGLYAVDMMNDIEIRYRIIRLVDLADEKARLIKSDINLELPENKALREEISQFYSDEFFHDEKELIGRDVALSFPSDREWRDFHQQSPYQSHCYLFYVKGYFVKGNEFYVEKYQVLPAWPKCIEEAKKAYDTIESECENSDNSYCR